MAIYSHIDLTDIFIPLAELNCPQTRQIYAENNFPRLRKIKFAVISAISVK